MHLKDHFSPASEI